MSKYVDCVTELNQIRASRRVLEQWVHLPCFEQLIKGMFVRIGVASNSYKVCEILDVVETPKVYPLGKTWTNKSIEIRHPLSHNKVLRLEYVSESEFTHEEFQEWVIGCQKCKIPLPTMYQIREKLEEIVENIHFQLKELANEDQDQDQDQHDEDQDQDPDYDAEMFNIVKTHIHDQQENENKKENAVELKEEMLNTEVPPENLVFSINLLLSMIIESVSHTDWFKSIRLVNSQWASVATKFLQQLRFGPSIQFTYDMDAQCFLHQMTLNTGEMTEETLERLTELINNSLSCIGFPCNEFRFSGGRLNDPQLQQFFDTHGSLVRKLTMNLSDDDEEEEGDEACSTLAYFTKLLTQQIPNLQYLGMDYFPKQWGKKSNEDCVLEVFPKNSVTECSVSKGVHYFLPNLRTLDFETAIPHEILLDLLRAAPKLEELFIPELNEPLVTYLIESNRLKLLQTFFTFNCKPENLVAYEKFAEAKLKLMKIEVDVSQLRFQRPFWPRMARCLSRILVSGADTLQRVFWCPVGHLPGLHIPTLNNVFTLSIQDADCHNDMDGDDLDFDDDNDNDNENDNGFIGGHGHGHGHDHDHGLMAINGNGNLNDHDHNQHHNAPLFPPGVSMKSVFPNLVAIDLTNRCTISDSVIDIYEPLQSVKKLSISQTNCISAEMITKFALMFPNVAEGTFKGIHNFPKVAKAIWKFLKLEELDLGFTVGCNCKGNVYPAIDVGLTGLTKGTCRMLTVMSEDEIGEQLDENLFRENPSILDLKELEILSLEFADDGDEMKDSECTPLITELTGKYAFELLANLEISVKIVVEEFSNFCKIKKCLDEIRPYVSNGPW